MTVEAKKLVNRDVYELTYEGASGDGIANVRMENPDTGDVSTTETKNDGKFTVTVGKGYEGVADVTISEGDGGGEIDSGQVVYGADAPEEPEAGVPGHPIVLPTPPDAHPGHPIELPDEAE
jgi:hypothetical protein